jgi:hypothetical protein
VDYIQRSLEKRPPATIRLLTDEVMDLIKDNIPEPLENKFHSEIIQGYNTAIKDIMEKF